MGDEFVWDRVSDPVMRSAAPPLIRAAPGKLSY
jgi:hypothetical protein